MFERESIKNLKSSFEELKEEFDVIIIDIDSLNQINTAKEWLLFSDRIIAVFKAGCCIQYKDQKQFDYLRNHQGFMGWVLNRSKLYDNKTNKIA